MAKSSQGAGGSAPVLCGADGIALVVGQRWVYRRGARESATCVEVRRLGTSRPPRVRVVFLDDAYEGREEWVPPGRLQTGWERVAEWQAREDRVRQKHANLGILNPARRSRILTGHTRRLGVLLDKSSLIRNQYTTIKISEAFHSHSSAVAAFARDLRLQRSPPASTRSCAPQQSPHVRPPHLPPGIPPGDSARGNRPQNASNPPTTRPSCQSRPRSITMIGYQVTPCRCCTKSPGSGVCSPRT
ncbi:hypothetical protein BJ969_003495 [Saccharopolyspora gloriosae]|uniref:Uncharacterized protein n=1 Tax=Saccharopolyspora gloriosae TaxID=455344 RepID=A0A840NQ91_9PSEU|nr:hypothetical protein [Saccharopolyspora gloriosae]